MLDTLKISNFALIETAELEFGPAFNVVTGESGAGKSIIMGALELLMGGRADRGVIRTGEERAEISGLFVVPENLRETLRKFFRSNDLPFDEDFLQIQFRRVIGQNSVRNYVNDSAVSARLLREIGEQLVDRHGANDQLSLLIPNRQLELLDRYAGAESLRQACETAFGELEKLRREREEFMHHLPDEAEKNRLELVLEDIRKVNPAENEDTELDGRYKLASGSREIIEETSAMGAMLSENENSVLDQLNSIYRRLQELSRIEESTISPLLEDCALIQESIQAFSGKLEDLASSVELDPEALQTMEARLSELFTLKRRYGPTLEQVFETLRKTGERLEMYRGTRQKQAEFAEKEKQLRGELAAAAEKLSRFRKAAAGKFSGEVMKKLADIGFLKCALAVEFSVTEPGASGADRIEMVFSANAGEEPRPLRKIASSGELSRLMLALKTVLADADSIPVVVFDEIDANIGGETANAVGRELQNLGRHRQILAISHLGQVAARADQHFMVEKFETAGRTVSRSRRLDNAGREKEIARMIGGGDAALLHARDILMQAKNS